jgi:negative regulator of sigma E activity
MKKARLEQVSSLVDDEQGGSGKSVVDDLLKDAESRDAWQRYHELGDWMRNMADGGMVRVDVADRVSAAIQGEPTLLFPVNHRQAPVSRPARRAWSQQLAGIGIAAAVATATILIFQQQEFLEVEPEVGVVATNETTAAGKEEAVLGSAGLAKVNSSEDDELLSGELFQQKLDAYLASHVNQSAGYRTQGLLPNIRAVDHAGTAKGN